MSEILSKFAKQNANQFKHIILKFYPLTEEILDKYLGKSYDSQILWNKVSLNENIKWTKQMIEKYKNNLVWDNLSANKKIPFTPALLEDYKNNWRFDVLSGNPAVPFTEDLIEKYKDKWYWSSLSRNPSLPWSDKLILKYLDKWEIIGFRENSKVNMTLPLIETISTKLDNPDISLKYFVSSIGIKWTYELVDKIKDEDRFITWRYLSANPALPWSKEGKKLFDRYQGYWYIQELSKVPNFIWSETIIKEHENEWDWGSLSQNTGVCFSERLIESFKDRWDWAGGGQWTGLSQNPSLPWSEKFIEKYMDKWGARGISNNTGIPWTLEFIEKYKTKLRLNMNDLIENQGVWKKAFEPLLNDKVLMKLLKELYP